MFSRTCEHRCQPGYNGQHCDKPTKWKPLGRFVGKPSYAPALAFTAKGHAINSSPDFEFTTSLIPVTYTHARTHSRTHSRTHARTHASKHAVTHMHTRTCTHTHDIVHTHMHTMSYAHTRARARARDHH